MNEKIQKTENNFAKRTDVLGVYNVNGAQTTISRAEDADLVFDIALNGKLLSLALKRSQHDTGKSPYTRCMGGGCAPAYKGEHLVDYSLRFDLDGISAGEQISFIGAKYDEWNDSPIPSYDVDIKKGIPQSEHKKIGEILKRQNEDMALIWNKFVLDAEQMVSQNNVKSSAFNSKLADFLYNGR